MERRTLAPRPATPLPSCHTPAVRFLWLSHKLLRWRASKGDTRKPPSRDHGRDVQLLQREQNPLSVSCKSTLDLQSPAGPSCRRRQRRRLCFQPVAAGLCWDADSSPDLAAPGMKSRSRTASGEEEAAAGQRAPAQPTTQHVPGIAWPGCPSSPPQHCLATPTPARPVPTWPTPHNASRSRCCPPVLLSLCPLQARMEKPQDNLLRGTGSGSRGTCLPRPLAIPSGRARAGPGAGRHHYSRGNNEFGTC